jgi:hypothetical protein
MPLSPILKGLLTFALPPALYARSSGRTSSARYCYSVYLRHIRMIGAAGLPATFESVAEIGPGASVGTGLAALAAGAERCYGFDIKNYGNHPDNALLFDDICRLFSERAPIPGEGEFPTIKPALPDEDFPSDILTEERLDRALDPARLARLRAALGAPDGPVTYAAPWYETERIRPGTVDWIFSQAVMEHVDDLPGTYAACHRWLAPGGVMSHQIDYKSHGTAPQWNGHWAYSETAWRMVRGARPYLVNRQPHSAHLRAIEDAGFEIVSVLPVERTDGLGRHSLPAPYRELSESDLTTAGAFILARKRESH